MSKLSIFLSRKRLSESAFRMTQLSSMQSTAKTMLFLRTTAIMLLRGLRNFTVTTFKERRKNFIQTKKTGKESVLQAYMFSHSLLCQVFKKMILYKMLHPYEIKLNVAFVYTLEYVFQRHFPTQSAKSSGKVIYQNTMQIVTGGKNYYK